MTAAARLRVGVLGLSHDHVWANLRSVAEGELGALTAVAEPDALLGARAVANVLEHHVTGDDGLDGTVEIARGRCGDEAVRPGPELAAEAGAEETRDDPDV